ncbi:rCG43781 [Rattus norvegicus]|uniref:RCG43781 n=1 Tax=Rattus norvegicus TaxID=10116 RepID=A6KUC1_RAT|nr:rCG43781 [Rattus norvegicus]
MDANNFACLSYTFLTFLVQSNNLQ